MGNRLRYYNYTNYYQVVLFKMDKPTLILKTFLCFHWNSLLVKCTNITFFKNVPRRVQSELWTIWDTESFFYKTQTITRMIFTPGLHVSFHYLKSFYIFGLSIFMPKHDSQLKNIDLNLYFKIISFKKKSKAWRHTFTQLIAYIYQYNRSILNSKN